MCFVLRVLKYDKIYFEVEDIVLVNSFIKKKKKAYIVFVRKGSKKGK